MKLDLSKLYNISGEEKVFIDTNVLVFLFSPFSMAAYNQSARDKYSEIFDLLVKKGAEIYVNSIVISEYINVCLRLDFDKNFNMTNKKDFKKDYRGSHEYKITLKSILGELKKIGKLTNRINDDFIKFDLISEYTVDINLDFNDTLIAETVIDNSLKLLTDDRDFNNYKSINIEWYYR